MLCDITEVFGRSDRLLLCAGGAYQGVLHAKTALEVLKSTVEVNVQATKL